MVLRAERQHEGRYVCQAKNGVGAAISKLVKLIVSGKLLISHFIASKYEYLRCYFDFKPTLFQNHHGFLRVNENLKRRLEDLLP